MIFFFINISTEEFYVDAFWNLFFEPWKLFNIFFKITQNFIWKTKIISYYWYCHWFPGNEKTDADADEDEKEENSVTDEEQSELELLSETFGLTRKH